MFTDFAKWPPEVLSLFSTESHCHKPSPEHGHGLPGLRGQVVWLPQTLLVSPSTRLALVPFTSATVVSLGLCACCSLCEGPVLASSPPAHHLDRSPIVAVSRNPSYLPKQVKIPPISALTAAAPFVALVIVVTLRFCV